MIEQVPYSGPPPGEADFDDMLHALGRPKSYRAQPYRNYYCTQAGGEIAKRFEALGWWDFSHFINGGRDAIYCVNGAGKQALSEWLKRRTR
jgi:hypothetical protein